MALDMESVAEATSGAIGALVSTTVLYPLDTCKTKYQAELRTGHLQKYRLKLLVGLAAVMIVVLSPIMESRWSQQLIWMAHGHVSDVLWEAILTRQILSLYQGLGTKNLQSFISQFVYFYGYSFFKRLYLKNSGSKAIGARANFLVAIAAAACTVVVTQPLDTASSKMQTSEFGKSKGLWKTLRERTWREAFDGLGISLLLTINPSIQYTVFDQLKLRVLKKENEKRGKDSSPRALSAFSAFVLGAVSKCVATCVTYPAIRCKVTIQASETEEDEINDSDPKNRKTISGALRSIWRREGLFGFFKGLQPQILKTVLSSALLLMVKEKITKSTWVILLAVRRFLPLNRIKLKDS